MSEVRYRNSVAICFVCSLSDFFHEGADHWRAEAWQVIRDCTNVKFMLLTKRPERIVRCLPADWDSGVYRNAWLREALREAENHPLKISLGAW